MTIVCNAIESNAQWLGLKKTVVGGSEIAALYDLHPYLSRWTLHQRKRGKLPEQPTSGAMKRGQYMEPVALKMLQERYPEWDVYNPRAHYSDSEYGLGATPDTLAYDTARGRGTIQIKSLLPSVLRDVWLNGSAIMPPMYVQLQVQLEMAMTDATWGAVAPIVVDHEIDLHVIEIPRRDDVIDSMKTRALEFWQEVFEDREPEPDYKRDAEGIRSLLRQDDGSEIDLSGDNELQDLIAQRELAKQLSKTYEDDAKGIDAQLLHKLGTAAVGRFKDGYIAAKTVHRAAYQVKETSYRQLRIVRRQEL